MIRLLHAIGADLRRQRMRGVLSATSMLLGVFGLVAVALIRGFASDVLIAAEERVNGRAPTYSAAVEASRGATADVAARVAERAEQLAPRRAQSLAVAIESAIFVAPDTATINDPGEDINITWSSNDPDAVRRVGISPMTLSEPPPLASVLVNDRYASRWRVGVGSVLHLRPTAQSPATRVVVSGIVHDAADSDRLFGSLDLLGLIGSPADGTVTMQTHAPEMPPETVAAWFSDAATDTQVRLDGPARRTDTVEEIRSQLAQLELLFTVLGVALLVVSAIGLLNIGLATVDERRRELALRRAVGARRRDIVGLVLGGSVLLSLPVIAVAGFAAFAGSRWLLPAVLEAATSEIPPFPWDAVAVAACAAVLTSLLGAAAPAIAAARVPIADALRT